MKRPIEDEKLRLVDWYYYWIYGLQLKLFGSNDPHGWAFHAINMHIMLVLFAIGVVVQYGLIPGLDRREYNLPMVICVVLTSYLVTYFLLGNEKSRDRRVTLIDTKAAMKYKWLIFVIPPSTGLMVWLILSWGLVWSK